jgi:hypothetical protein
MPVVDIELFSTLIVPVLTNKGSMRGLVSLQTGILLHVLSLVYKKLAAE